MTQLIFVAAAGKVGVITDFRPSNHFMMMEHMHEPETRPFHHASNNVIVQGAPKIFSKSDFYLRMNMNKSAYLQDNELSKCSVRKLVTRRRRLLRSANGDGNLLSSRAKTTRGLGKKEREAPEEARICLLLKCARNLDRSRKSRRRLLRRRPRPATDTVGSSSTTEDPRCSKRATCDRRRREEEEPL